VLLLDEPLSNLDAKIRIQVRAEIRKLQKELAITTIYVTHDQEEALTLSDRIAVLDHGKIQQLGSPRDLYQRPENPFVADFIGINNLIPGKVKEALDSGTRLVVESVAGPIACAGDGRLAPGNDCMVCIRPETAEISLSATPLEGFNSIPGIVSFPSYIGNTIRYDVDAGGIIFKVDIQNPREHQLMSVGTKVFIRFAVTSSLGIPKE
jgi:ABC-type Fe3+/spermidine/putrescine transport system ATPase subunit